MIYQKKEVIMKKWIKPIQQMGACREATATGNSVNIDIYEVPIGELTKLRDRLNEILGDSPIEELRRQSSCCSEPYGGS